MDWLDDAACREQPTEVFFIETRGWSGASRMAVEVACGGCSVRLECLEAALREEQKTPKRSYRFGIRGGLNPRQRAELWDEILSRGAGWCQSNLHIVERDDRECAECKKKSRRAS